MKLFHAQNKTISGGALGPNEVWLIVFNGESNSRGYALNSDAASGEVDVNSGVQIFDNTGLSNFLSLDIGTNNEGFSSVEHGWELQLSNRVDDATMPNPVYIVKTGQGGSKISEWNVGGTYETTMKSRINAAKAAVEALGKTPRIVVWYSLGINDRIAGTNESTWRTAVEAHFANIRTTYGSTIRIHMTKLMSLKLDSSPNPNADFNDTIDALAAADSLTWAIDGDAALRDDNHWSYSGMKTLTDRLITSTLANL